MAWHNRSVWLRCIASMLNDQETRRTALNSIEAATRFVNQSDELLANQRWLALNTREFGNSLLITQNLEPLVKSASSGPSGNMTPLVDLHQLYKSIPEIEIGTDERELGSNMKLLIGLVFVSIAAVSLSLNAIAVMVLAKYRRGPWKYLVNLSVSDVVGLVCYTIWISDFVAVATMIAIVRKRRRAILRPLKPMDSFKIWRFRIGQTLEIFLTWLVAIFYSLPQNFIYKNAPICFRDQFTFTCLTEMSSEVIFDSFLGLYYLLSFVLPFLYLCFVYTKIAIEFYDHQRPAARRRAKRLKTIKMLLVVVVAFVACWLPVRVINLIYIFQPGLLSDCEPPVASIYTQISLQILIMLHTCINPIIYCFLGGEFRRGLRGSLLAVEGSSALATQSEFQCSSEVSCETSRQVAETALKRDAGEFETSLRTSSSGAITELANGAQNRVGFKNVTALKLNGEKRAENLGVEL